MRNGLIRWPTIIVGATLLLLPLRIAHSQASPPDQQAQSEQQGFTPRPDPNRSLMGPLKSQVQNAPYEAITARERVRWIVDNSVGPTHLLAGIFSAGFGAALDRPQEHGPHWQGFGERYGMRLTSIVPGNIMEAEIGAAWGEDPRYFRVPDEGSGGCVKNVVKQTFEARHPDGSFAPAYARFISLPASNFLSNAWRRDSEANDHDAVLNRRACSLARRRIQSRLAGPTRESWIPLRKSRLRARLCQFFRYRTA